MLDAINALPVPQDLPFSLRNIRCRIRQARTVVYIPCDEPEEEIYGLGLDPKAYRQKGLRKRLTVSAVPIGKTGASHGPVPFYVSTKGYGVWVDTARVPFVHVARLSPKEVSEPKATRKPQELGTSEADLYAAQEGSEKLAVVFDIPGAQGVDIYVFGGPTIRESVQRYNLFSGGGAMPPLWGLGLKYRNYTQGDAKTVMNVAKTLREQRIPCDMMGLEPGWQTAAYSCSLLWSEKRFPNHQQFVDELIAMGYRVNLWEHAYIHPTSPLYPKLKPHSGDFVVWKGLVVDFADSKAFQIFADYHEDYLVKNGITGFKADECDRQPITDVTPFNYPYCSTFPSGIDGDQMTQLYGYLYQRCILSVFNKNNLRTWSDVRATASLAAPLPFNLYSDAYDQSEYLRQLLNASFAGLLWSPEVRAAQSRAELTSRVGMAVFSAQTCFNPWSVPNPLWMQFDGEKNKKNIFLPKHEMEEVIAEVRELVELRMSLIPYLYAAFYRYRQQGLPPVRALPIEYPGDKRVRRIEDAYMFGDNLLVTPIPAGRTERSVYFPAGENWIDFKSHTKYRGGKSYPIEVRAGETPVFVRENSLVPLAKPVQYVADDTVFEITVYVYGDNPEPFVLFEDDGISYDHQKGVYNEVTLWWDAVAKKGKVARQGRFKGRRYDIAGWARVEPQSL
jgi:alpha-D-xyloside xylohydrolase